MTKGKIVLELLKYAKSAMKNFNQSGASFGSHMTTMEASDRSKYFLQIWHIRAIHFFMWRGRHCSHHTAVCSLHTSHAADLLLYPGHFGVSTSDR